VTQRVDVPQGVSVLKSGEPAPAGGRDPGSDRDPAGGRAPGRDRDPALGPARPRSSPWTCSRVEVTQGVSVLKSDEPALAG